MSARIPCQKSTPLYGFQTIQGPKSFKDRLHCPVRALKFYFNRVKSIRGSRKRIFIPLKGGGGDVSAASISCWVASTIKKAYSSLSSKDLSFLKIRPHELRALLASWAFVNHTPLSDVLQAAFWRNRTTFSSFYLRSFEHQQDNLYLLGPLVVAQTVVLRRLRLSRYQRSQVILFKED